MFLAGRRKAAPLRASGAQASRECGGHEFIIPRFRADCKERERKQAYVFFRKYTSTMGSARQNVSRSAAGPASCKPVRPSSRGSTSRAGM